MHICAQYIKGAKIGLTNCSNIFIVNKLCILVANSLKIFYIVMMITIIVVYDQCHPQNQVDRR